MAQLPRFSAALCRGLIEAQIRYGIVSPTSPGFPRLYAAASLKRRGRHKPVPGACGFPRLYAAASLKRRAGRYDLQGARGFPRLYAAASLKLDGAAVGGGQAHGFSAALCRGLIEAGSGAAGQAECATGFPRLYAAASLKHNNSSRAQAASIRFPRLYAAASLKPVVAASGRLLRSPFSAALCRGLIEAGSTNVRRISARRVFRGFMPRPH